jgi:hypothetical protein
MARRVVPVLWGDVTREVRIRYYDSGVPPTSGSVGIDGSLDFLAHFGAAAIGPSRGYDSAEILRLRTLAMGERLDGSGGMLYDLIQPMVRSLQRVQRQPRPYGAGAYSWKRSRPPLYIAAPPAEGGVTQIFSIAGAIDGVEHHVHAFRVPATSRSVQQRALAVSRTLPTPAQDR